MCPKDTVFDQQNFICTNWWEIVCEESTKYYDKNNELFGHAEPTPEYEYENIESPVYYEYIYEYETETTTKAQVREPLQPIEEHRLSFGKLQKEVPAARSIEVTFSSHANSGPFNGTLYGAAIPSTTKQPTTTSTTTKITTTTSKPPSTSSIQTPHRLTFKSLSENDRLSSQRTRLTSRGRDHHRFNEEDATAPEISQVPEVTEQLQDDPLTLDLDSQDPFANYDWKKDSTGVTASARTRYETLFGRKQGEVEAVSHQERRKHPSPVQEKSRSHPSTDENERSRRPTSEVKAKEPPRPVRLRNPTNRPNTVIATPTNQNSSGRRDTRRQKGPEAPNQANPQPQFEEELSTLPEAKHKEFSNFRFYKTAFGRSYSSDDHLGTTGTTASPLRVSDPIRVERIASRNTRYSIYAEGEQN